MERTRAIPGLCWFACCLPGDCATSPALLRLLSTHCVFMVFSPCLLTPQRMSITKPALIITFIAIVLFALTGAVASLFVGKTAFSAAGIAVGACWLGSLLGIISINFFRYALKKDFPWFIIGALFRLGVPLLAAVAVAFAAEKDFGFLVLILFPVIYLLMLPVDVLLAQPEQNSSKPGCDCETDVTPQ